MYRLLNFLFILSVPPLEFYFIYWQHLHPPFFRALRQYSELPEIEKMFLWHGLLHESTLAIVYPVLIYAGSMTSDKLIGHSLPNTLYAWIVLAAIYYLYPSSFHNSNERTNMRRLEGVILQTYVIVVSFLTCALVILLDYIFLLFIPLPLAIFDLQSGSKLPIPKPFTLGRLLWKVFPQSMYVAINFYIAHLCFILWFRIFYYGYKKRYWWSIEEDDEETTLILEPHED